MSRTQIQQIVVIVLLVGFGVIWATTRKSTVLRPPALAPSAPATRAAAPAGTREAEPTLQERAGEEAVSLARDLFHLPDRIMQKIRTREQSLEQQPSEPSPAVEQAPVALPPEISSLKLQGIFWGGDQPRAIINRKILSVGDTIDGATVTAITKEGVTLTQGGQPLEIKPSVEIQSGQDGAVSFQESDPHEH